MNQREKRLAGAAFLSMVVFGLAAELFFRQRIFAGGDLAELADRILSNELLYRAGIVCDLLMALCYLVTALLLAKALSPVSRSLSTAMLVLAAAGSVLLMGNTLNEFAPLAILASPGTEALGEAALQALAQLFYELYGHGYMIGQIFFALWVLPLGLLIRRSGSIPRFLGALFFVEALCGTAAVLVHFLTPAATVENILLLPGVLAEFAFLGWLLFSRKK